MASFDERNSKTEFGFLREIDPLISFSALLAGLVVWIYSTFATVVYVKEMHQEEITHSDENRARMEAVLGEIRETVKLIESRTWDMDGSHSRAKRSERSRASSD